MVKVLIVDDEKWVRRGVIEKTDWESLDAQVVGEARNGLEGMEMAKKYLPDIVVTDMKMPVMDGIEYISKLRDLLPKTKVIVISGYSDFEYTRQALINKAVDYILKPIEPSVINEVMGRAIREWGISGQDMESEKSVNGHLTGLENEKEARAVIKTVKEYICCHYSEKISLNIISKKFFISETYFCKLFKKETGLNFLDYLTNVRMENAGRLIRSYNCKIYQVASMVGYEDPRHFSKLYRKYVSSHSTDTI